MRDARTKQRPFPHRRFCCPLGSSSTTAASDAHPALAHFPDRPVIGRDAPTTTFPQGRRAGEGLPSSRRHLPNVQHPIRREVHQGCASRLFTPSVAFAPNGRARLLLSPPEGGLLTTRQVSLDAADRLVAPPEGLLTLGFDPTRFQTEPPACYRASWQLPGRDSHPLATTSLCWITIYISALQLWAHPP
jgi:hypothetical protein